MEILIKMMETVLKKYIYIMCVCMCARDKNVRYTVYIDKLNQCFYKLGNDKKKTRSMFTE